MNVLSWPAVVALEITAACSNRCPGCSNVYAAARAGRVTPADQWERWLAEFAPEAVQIRLTGGEPTLHPEFGRIFAAAVSYDARVTVFTNGRWRDPHGLIRQVRGRANFSGLLISLHGARAETHEAFSHVPGSFDETLANIRLAVEAGVPVALSTVLTRQSWREAAGVAALGKELGVQHVAFNRYIGAPNPEIEPDLAEMQQAVSEIEQMIAAGENIRYGVGVPQCFAPNASDGCLAGAAYASVDPWGNLRPCAHSPMLAGSLDQSSFQQIWNGEKMAAWRALMPPECTRCAAYAICHGGCRAVQELRPDGRDPLRCQPVRSLPRARKKRPISPSLKPRLACRLRPEPFGYAALGNGQVLPLRAPAREILLECNGSRTVKELADQYGRNGLNLLGEMLQLGLLEAG